MNKIIQTALPILFLWMCFVGSAWEKHLVFMAIIILSALGLWQGIHDEIRDPKSFRWGVFVGFVVCTVVWFASQLK